MFFGPGPVEVQEEERLRKLEKQRQAGELQRMEKSAVDRSSEAQGHPEAPCCLNRISIDIDTLVLLPYKKYVTIWIYVFIYIETKIDIQRKCRNDIIMSTPI